MSTSIRELYRKRVVAGKALQEALEKRYPKDSEVTVMFSCRQIRPSRCRVFGCDDNGMVRVCLIRDDGDPGRRNFVKDRFFDDIVDPSVDWVENGVI